MKLSTPADAHTLLRQLGATERLLTHVRLVGEAAEEVLQFLSTIGVQIDKDLVRIGVAVHDAGKIVHHSELDAPGSEHEPEGQRLILEAGVDPTIARCCLSHARYAEMQCSTEELLVALADKLWKGKRVHALETEIIDRVASSIGKTRWDLFVDLEACFEAVAARGEERLARSRRSA